MARILSTLLLLYLFYEFWFWFKFAEQHNALPNFLMLVIHIVGILVLLGLVIPRTPQKMIGQISIVWCVIYLIHGVVNFQQFNFEGVLRSWIAPLILYSLFISPVTYYAVKVVKSHNKSLKSGAPQSGAP